MRLRDTVKMKIVLKGILTREDAELAVGHGIDGIIVSNHGGRVVDSGRATIEVLPEVIEAVGSRVPVLVDSGFRRGTDIIKALALGARGVCIGRPYLWGLAAFGQPGVERVLEILRAETRAAMQQVGAPATQDLTPAMGSELRPNEPSACLARLRCISLKPRSRVRLAGRRRRYRLDQTRVIVLDITDPRAHRPANHPL